MAGKLKKLAWWPGINIWPWLSTVNDTMESRKEALLMRRKKGHIWPLDARLEWGVQLRLKYHTHTLSSTILIKQVHMIYSLFLSCFCPYKQVNVGKVVSSHYRHLGAKSNCVWIHYLPSVTSLPEPQVVPAPDDGTELTSPKADVPQVESSDADGTLLIVCKIYLL